MVCIRVLLLGCIWLTVAPLIAASSNEVPQTPIQIPAVYIDIAPVIDGKVDDPCWSKATKVTEFYVLDLDEPLPEETIAYLCVDDKALYAAVLCKDHTPEDIIAQETRRGGELWGDDCVEFGLDPWNKHDATYSFLVSARGTQYEDLPGGSAIKIEWRGDWTAATTRTSEGWTVEIAIPFSILRYPPDQATFGFYFSRHLGKERVWECYPYTGRPWNGTLAVDLTGLHPPMIHPRPILMPYVTLDSGDETQRVDVGLDVQYKLPNGLTALGSLNPDFRHIEDVVEPISFTYTERYLPDPRPFFITGQQGYFPNRQLLYTRRIADFDAGLKVFGTVGNETIGLLDAVTFHEENSLAVMWTHRINDDNAAQVMLVDHSAEGAPHNLAFGVGGTKTWRRPDGSDNVWVLTYQSHEQDSLSGGWYEIGGGHERGNGRPWWGWTLRTVAADFLPALGYNTDQNTIGGEFDYGVQTRYEKSSLERREWGVNSGYLPYHHGDGIYHSYLSPFYYWGWSSGRSLSLGITQATYYNQDSSDVHGSVGWNNRDMYRQGGIYLLEGVRAGGDYHYVSLSQGFQPKSNLKVNLSAEYSHLEPPSPEAYHAYQTVFTASYDLTPEKCVSARMITRDGGTSVFATYRQVVRRGMDMYLLLGDPNPEETGFISRVAVKFIWVM